MSLRWHDLSNDFRKAILLSLALLVMGILVKCSGRQGDESGRYQIVKSPYGMSRWLSTFQMVNILLTGMLCSQLGMTIRLVWYCVKIRGEIIGEIEATFG